MIKAEKKIPSGCYSNPIRHSVNRNHRSPQFVCMLYSPGSSSYASTPRIFKDDLDPCSHFNSYPRSYPQDGFHRETSSHFIYPDQQLNSSSRNPHPLSQRGQTNNTYPNDFASQEYYSRLSQSGQINNIDHSTYQLHYPNSSQSGQTNNDYSTHFTPHKHPSHLSRREQFDNSPSNNLVRPEYHHNSHQNVYGNDFNPVSPSRPTSSQDHYNNFNPALQSQSKITPPSSAKAPFQPSSIPLDNDPIQRMVDANIDRPIVFVEPPTTIHKAIQALTSQWMMNPYSNGQYIIQSTLEKIEAKIEFFINSLLNQPKFLRTLLPKIPADHSCHPPADQNQNSTQMHTQLPQVPARTNEESTLLPDLTSFFDSNPDPNPIPAEDSSHSTRDCLDHLNLKPHVSSQSHK